MDPVNVTYHHFTTTPVGPCTLYKETLIAKPGTVIRQPVFFKWGADNAILHYKPVTGSSYQAYQVWLMAPDGPRDCHDGTTHSVA